MIKLRYKLGLFNLVSKILFGILFLASMPLILERINTEQTDNELIGKREQVLEIIAEWGVESFLSDDQESSFGSYNILKEEYISIEKVNLDENWNFIEITNRLIEDEIIDYRVLNYSFLVDDEMYLLEIGKSLKSIKQTEKHIRTFTLIFLLVFILVSFISDLTYVRTLTSPLEKITDRLKKTLSPAGYGMSGHLPTNTYEYAYLDRTLSELMRKLDLLIQNEKQVTSNISHELLTPVSVLRSKMENMLALPHLDPEVEIKLEESLKTLHRLKTMVKSLMMIARLESQQYLKEDSFNVKDIIDEVLEELSPISEDKEVTIVKQLNAAINISAANRSLFFIMIYNVINNAVKFTPPKGVITITTEMISSKPNLKVSDTGEGMDKTQLDELFSRFKKKSATDEKGNGLGLAITKSIAEFHNIPVTVSSNRNIGTQFSFFFDNHN
jgi:signal transduction histidine kinase